MGLFDWLFGKSYTASEARSYRLSKKGQWQKLFGKSKSVKKVSAKSVIKKVRRYDPTLGVKK